MSKDSYFVFNLNYLKSNLDELNETLGKCLDYLKNFNKQLSKLLTDKKAYNAFIFISKSLYDLQDEIDMTLFDTSSFEIILASFFMNFYEIRDELKLNLIIKPHAAEISNDFDEKRIHLFSNLLFVTNKLTFRWKTFGARFVLKDGLKPFFLFMNDDKFLTKNRQAKINDLSCEPIDLIDYFELNVYCLRFTCDEYKEVWLKLDAINVLLKILKLKPTHLTFTIFRTISFILDDERADTLSVTSLIIEFVIKYFLRCKIDFDSDIFNARPFKFTMKDNKVLIYEVHCVLDELKRPINMQGLFECIYKLSVNDKTRKKIYFKDGLKECLNSFLLKGNYMEINLTLELLAQLSFDNDIRDDMNASSDFQTNLSELEKIDVNKVKDVNKKCVIANIKILLEQIKWNLNANSLTSSPATTADANTSFQHVMISYNVLNLAEKEFCLGLKAKLESLNDFRVWLNENGEATLYEMTKAVENSFCMLMCVSEKYRQSIPCQIEAQHGFRLKKKILPFICHKNASFENFRGWLGAVVSLESFLIDFVKIDFDECIYRIKHEIEALRPNAKSKKEEPTFSVVKITDEKKSLVMTKPDEWTDVQVKEWFIKNDINLLIFDYFRPCTGKILRQMYQMNVRTPEFYNQSMKEIKNIKFNMIVSFTACLEELFR